MVEGDDFAVGFAVYAAFGADFVVQQVALDKQDAP